ncbi:MAG TPA: hypothetical protein VGC87_13815 [Pyrinomonadaceae bacterium]|jgi:hypothetical protein
MSRQSDEEVLMRKYLLGDLDEKQQEQVEERLLCDDGFADRLDAAQDHLLDDYAFNLLPEGEREKFEQNFTLDGERREKLLFAQALESYVSADDARPREDVRPPSRWWKNLLLLLGEHKAWSAAAFATLVLLIFLAPKITSWLKPDDHAAASQYRADIERQLAELNRRPLEQTQPTFDLTLQPVLLRGGGELKEAVLAGQIKNLGLKLALPQVRYGRYRALAQTVEGTELFAVGGLEPASGAAEVLLRIPSEFLPAGDYQIELKGVAADGHEESAARYFFRVRK